MHALSFWPVAVRPSPGLGASDIEDGSVLDRSPTQFDKLLEVSVSLTSTLDLDALLERIVGAAQEVLLAEAASILLVDEATGRLKFAHVVVPVEAVHIVPLLKATTLAHNEGIAGYCVSRNEPVIIEDCRTDRRWSSRVDGTTGFVTRDLLCVPLVAEGQVLGALEIVNKKTEPYAPADIPICTAFASLAGTALRNAQLHLKLARAHERLQELESTRTQYVSTVSHELRTPITVIKGYVQVLEQFRSRLADEKQAEFLRSIDREADHLASLIDDLFIVNEIKELPRQCSFMPTDVVALVERYVEHWAQTHPDRAFHFHRDGPPSRTLAVDQKKIKQCLYHALDNATKFSTAGTSVEVHLRDIDTGCELTVVDEGIGIPAEALPRIYDPFWQADGSDTRSYGGLGLGLYIVSQIMAAHGGSVHCESTPGEGTHLTLTLPLQ